MDWILVRYLVTCGTKTCPTTGSQQHTYSLIQHEYLEATCGIGSIVLEIPRHRPTGECARSGDESLQSKHSVFNSPHLSRHCHGMQATDWHMMHNA